jgi:WD40 repeat protein
LLPLFKDPFLVKRHLFLFRQSLIALLLGAVSGLTAAAQDLPKTALDKLDPKKLPAALKPKGSPKDVLAILGERDGRYDSLAFRPDGSQMAVGGPDGKVRIWDLSTLKITGTATHKDVVCLAYSPSGKTLAAADALGNLKFWTIESGRPTLATTLPGAHKAGPIWAMNYSADGKSFFSGGADKLLKIWDAGRLPPQLKATLPGHDDRIRGLAVSRDGKRLVTASDRDKTIRLWDLAGKPKEQTKIPLKSGALTVAFSPDGQTLAAGCADGSVLTWKLGDLGDKPGEPNSLRTGKGVIFSVAFAPDGKSLLGLVKLDAMEDRIYVWDLEGKQRFEGKYGMHIEATAFDPGGRHVIVVNEASLYLVRVPE